MRSALSAQMGRVGWVKYIRALLYARVQGRMPLKGTSNRRFTAGFAAATTSAETVRLRRRIGLERGGKTAAVQTSPFLRPFLLRGRLWRERRLGRGTRCRPSGWLGGR